MRHARLAAALVAATLLVPVTAVAGGASASGPTTPGAPVSGAAATGDAPDLHAGPTQAPAVAAAKKGLPDQHLEALVSAVAAARPVAHDDRALVEGPRRLISVEVLFDGPARDARAAVAAAGGRTTGEVPGELLAADVPAAGIRPLQAAGGVTLVRLPLLAAAPQGQPESATVPPASSATTTDSSSTTVGVGAFGLEEVLKTAASSWQDAGFRGTGVRVGIIDFFSGTAWTAAAAAGELPSGAAAPPFCLRQGAACNPGFWDTTEVHGVAVAEVVHDMAPDAQLYLASALSTADLLAAVDYFVSNGVRIISRSQTARYDGPGNGTGPLASVVDYAVSRGITWVNSAGNSAGSAADPGAYWRGRWVDADADGWLDFAPGDELMRFDCGFINGLRWDDWAATGRTDYDAYIYADDGITLVGKFDDDQPAGALPIELPTCKGTWNYLAVNLFAAGTGTGDDTLEFMTNGAQVEYWQNPFSVTGPVADSASAGMLSVGAVDPVGGSTIADYSSQGPTNDGRLKPDLAAAAGMSSFSYQGPFHGTSAATPVTAGAAALVLQRFPGLSPAAVASYLRATAVERGVAGPDYVFGVGELALPVIAPPAPAPAPVPVPAPVPAPTPPPTPVFTARHVITVSLKTKPVRLGKARSVRVVVAPAAKVRVVLKRVKPHHRLKKVKAFTTNANGKLVLNFTFHSRGTRSYRFVVPAYDLTSRKFSIKAVRR